MAGAVNAGGFLAIGRYTSHLSGIISSIGDDLVLHDFEAVIGGFLMFLSFLLGAATTAILVNWGNRRRIYSKFAVPLLLEALLLLLFGLIGSNIDVYRALTIPVVAVLLCYVMGLQNALLTKVSKSEIRTTHITGVVTDLGIELGKLIYWNKSDDSDVSTNIYANRGKMKGLALILSMFSIGGVVGAYGFARAGYISVIPLASILLVIALSKVYKDIEIMMLRK